MNKMQETYGASFVRAIHKAYKLKGVIRSVLLKVGAPFDCEELARSQSASGNTHTIPRPANLVKEFAIVSFLTWWSLLFTPSAASPITQL